MKSSRRGLNNGELGLLVMFIAASGEWEDRGVRRIEAFSALVDICKTLASSEDLERTLDGLALSCQNALMAYRRHTFESVQKEPPFRSKARENLKLLTNAWALGREGSMLEEFTTLFADRISNRHGESIFRIVSGDGKTIDSPVKFSDCAIEARSKCECWFINYTLGYENEDWFRGWHFTTSRGRDGLGISLWEVSLPDGRNRSFYFDTNWV